MVTTRIAVTKKKRAKAAGAKSPEKVRVEGVNKVRLLGVIASATTSRERVLSRRIEIPSAGGRESIDVECEKGEISPLFRKLRINQWVEIEGRIRRRFWRSGAAIASRSYVEVLRITPR